MTRKDLLKRNIDRLNRLCSGSKLLRSAFELMPKTFVLPHEYTKFVSHFYKEEERLREQATALENPALPNYWILKPVGLSRGRGISLISDIGAVKYDCQTVAQAYLHNPLLIDGFKFDLRLYCLVTSFQPLEAFLYREGFVRLSTRRFSLDIKSQDDLLVHLTNSSIQKNADGFRAADGSLSPGSKSSCGVKGPGGILHVTKGEEDESKLGGTKRTLPWLWKTLERSGHVKAEGGDSGKAVGSAESCVPESSPGTVAELWAKITEVVVKTLMCVDGPIAAQPNSFELYGFDVIIDDDMRPWVLEVNSSPAMARECELDKRVKEALIRDTVALVDPLPFDRGALVETIERRRKASRARPSAAGQRRDLLRDLKAILKGRVPRQVGELPAVMGNYELLAPGTPVYAKCIKIKAAVSR